jgi:hypothetical protein
MLAYRSSWNFVCSSELVPQSEWNLIKTNADYMAEAIGYRYHYARQTSASASIIDSKSSSKRFGGAARNPIRTTYMLLLKRPSEYPVAVSSWCMNALVFHARCKVVIFVTS